MWFSEMCSGLDNHRSNIIPLNLEAYSDIMSTWLFAVSLALLLRLPLYFPGQPQTKLFGVCRLLVFWLRGKMAAVTFSLNSVPVSLLEFVCVHFGMFEVCESVLSRFSHPGNAFKL